MTMVRIPVTSEQVLLRVEMTNVSKNSVCLLRKHGLRPPAFLRVHVDNPRFFRGLWFRTTGLSTASHVIFRMGTQAAGWNSLLLCNADYKRQSMQYQINAITNQCNSNQWHLQ